MPVRTLLSPVPSEFVTRRMSPRIEVDGVTVQVRFADTGAPVVLNDLSSRGFGILTGQPVHVGTMRQFRVGRDESSGLLISAQATHCRQIEPGVFLSGWEAHGDASAQVIDTVFQMMTTQGPTTIQ